MPKTLLTIGGGTKRKGRRFRSLDRDIIRLSATYPMPKHRDLHAAYLRSMVDLKQTLSRFLAIPGVRQAVLVGRDGLMIEGMTREGKEDMEAVGAITTTGLSTAEALGKEISRGSVVGVIMEYEHGLVSVDPLGDFALMVTLSDNASNIGRVRHLVKASRNEILEALDIA